ncbi:hypothetical protein D3C81_1636240 [compost metagenome]
MFDAPFPDQFRGDVADGGGVEPIEHHHQETQQQYPDLQGGKRAAVDDVVDVQCVAVHGVSFCCCWAPALADFERLPADVTQAVFALFKEWAGTPVYPLSWRKHSVNLVSSTSGR